MKVSIRLMTYNHEAYIEEALDGINNQKTNFDFEVVVGDDFSTDNTLQKIKNYHVTNSKLHMRILERTKGDAYHVVRQEKGRLYNFVNIIEHCKGTYIALLDGDDYWIDPYKLQKQVDFLEANDDYFFVSANSQFLKNNQLEETKIGGDLVLQDFINGNKLGRQAAAFMFRNKQVTRFLDDLKAYPWPFGDLLLIFWCLKQGKGMVLDEVMVYYRIHDTGLWSSITMKSRLQNMIMFYTLAYKSEIHPNYNFDLYKLSVDSVLNKVFESNKTIRAEQSSNGVLKALKKLLKEVFNYG
ncbi:glycosyltransferase family 2 protein [Corallibacter sp.]|uniref:glycosyltransferase family 2 protein n=1 Tax=Corallibacter sp. TaxID=2038084 RepID=UPI003AB3D8A7